MHRELSRTGRLSERLLSPLGSVCSSFSVREGHEAFSLYTRRRLRGADRGRNLSDLDRLSDDRLTSLDRSLGEASLS